MESKKAYTLKSIKTIKEDILSLQSDILKKENLTD